MNTQEVILNKYKLVQEFINSQEIVELIVNKSGIDIGDYDISDTNIFPYLYVPEVNTETNTYLCLEIDIPQTTSNTISRFSMFITIFTSYSLQKLPSSFKRKGCRTDNLQMEIDKIVNGSREFSSIGQVELVSAKSFVWNDIRYSGKTIRYDFYNFNQNEGQY